MIHKYCYSMRVNWSLLSSLIPACLFFSWIAGWLVDRPFSLSPSLSPPLSTHVDMTLICQICPLIIFLEVTYMSMQAGRQAGVEPGSKALLLALALIQIYSHSD